MFTQPKVLLLSLILVLGLVQCTDDIPAGEAFGSVVVGVKHNALSVADIARIQVTASGAHIDPPITIELTGDPTSGWSGLIEAIPAGEERTFRAEAFDSGDVLRYSGEATGVTIVDRETAQVVIYLQQEAAPEPFVNAVPRFESIVLSGNQVAPGHDVVIDVAASDPNGDPIAFSWSATGGVFDDATSPNTFWTAPATPGLYQLTVSAVDSRGASATAEFAIDVQIHYGAGDAQISIDINTWPVVAGLVPTPTRIDVGESTALALTAVDPDGDLLSFSWTADCAGTFNDPTLEDPIFTLTSGSGGEDCILSALITDGRGGSNTAIIAIETGPPIDIDLLTDSFTGFSQERRYSSTGLGVPTQRVYGWRFEAQTDFAIDRLGYFDSGEDGLLFDHHLGIWGEDQQLLTSATVPAGTGGELVDGFRWIDVAPVTVSAGQRYVIAATIQGSGDDKVLRYVDATNLTFDPRARFVEGRIDVDATGLEYPAQIAANDLLIYLVANFHAMAQ